MKQADSCCRRLLRRATRLCTPKRHIPGTVGLHGVCESPECVAAASSHDALPLSLHVQANERAGLIERSRFHCDAINQVSADRFAPDQFLLCRQKGRAGSRIWQG